MTSLLLTDDAAGAAAAFLMLLFIGGCLIGVLFYFLPSFIAGARGKGDQTVGIMLVNLFFGWTVLGWLACLIWACTGESELRQQQHRELLAALGGKTVAQALPKWQSRPIKPRKPMTRKQAWATVIGFILVVSTMVVGHKIMTSPRPLTAGLVMPTPEVRRAIPVAANSDPTSLPNVVPAPPASNEPEVRKAQPVRPEDRAKAQSGAQNRVAIRPLKRTYVRVTLGDDEKPAFERWVSPTDGPVEFRGKHVSIRVLEREALTITKNGQALQENDQDVTVN